MALDKYPRICISAGHGAGSRGAGSDPGAQVVKYDGTEDDLVLNAAKSVVHDLKILFAAKKRGKVFLRDSGWYYLADDFAVNNECDVFVELHTDSAGLASGTAVLFNTDYSEAFADGMARRVSTALHIRNRGAVHRDNLAVLSPHKGMKQILIELFVGSNPYDVAHWKTYRDAAILAIVNGILVNRGWKPLTKRPSKMSKLALAAYRPF